MTTSPTETTREVERKLRVHALFRLPSLAGVTWGAASIEPQPTFTMTNTYFDTEDLRLFRWGVTLRRREGGPDEGWQMKLPVEGRGEGTRDEVKVPIGEVRDTVPAELTTIVSALIREARLVPVVVLRTERSPYLLLDATGAPTAELVDDTVAVLDGERTAAIFREIEVEAVPLADGPIDETVLDDVVAALVEHGAVPGTASKAASALGPRAAAPPDIPEPRWPGPHDPAGDAVRALIATHVRRLLMQDIRVHRDLPDAVHQLRVAARRLRSGLQVFRPLLDREWADAIRAELKWAAGNLGDARDTEVLLDRLDEHTRLLDPQAAEHARAIIDPALSERLRASLEAALEQMSTDRYRALLVTLVEAAQSPRLTDLAHEPCDEVLPALVAKSWHRLRRDVRDLRLDSPSVEWHETRIAGKRARYATEAVVPVFGKRAKAFADALSDVTDVLGTHQDAHVSQTTLRELAERASGPQGFALGLLHGIEIDAEMADRHRFERLWPSIREAARRSRLV